MEGDGEERVLFCSCAFFHALGFLVTPFTWILSFLKANHAYP